MDYQEIEFRKEIARALIVNDMTEIDGMLEVDENLLEQEAHLMALSDSIKYPNGLAPTPRPIIPKPSFIWPKLLPDWERQPKAVPSLVS